LQAKLQVATKKLPDDLDSQRGFSKMPRKATKRSTDTMRRLDARAVLHGIAAGRSVTVISTDTGQCWQIAIDRTGCTYGGFRSWWLCPRCSTRVGVLWGDSEGFACRRCQRLAYESTRIAASSQPFHRADKLRRQLGWTPGLALPPGGRPTGMHWRTYSQLVARLHRLTLDALRITNGRTARIKRNLASIGME
jgi:hypothetical protein